MAYTVQYRTHGNLYQNQSKEALDDLLALAWKAVAMASTDVRKEIFLRSNLHCTTTTTQGQHLLDPRGWHIAVSYKTQQHVDAHTHMTLHAYTTGSTDFEPTIISLAPEKPDTTPSSASRVPGSVVWPSPARTRALPARTHDFSLGDEIDTSNILVIPAEERRAPPRSNRPRGSNQAPRRYQTQTVGESSRHVYAPRQTSSGGTWSPSTPNDGTSTTSPDQASEDVDEG